MRISTAILMAVALVVCGLGGGLLAGYKIFSGEDTTISKPLSKNNGSGVVAIVSYDTGVENDGELVNYADAFIGQLDGDEYVYSASANDAEKGLNNGEYDAIMTFPANLSEQIVNNGYNNPDRIQIKYCISDNINDKSKLNAHELVIDAYNKFNDNLSYSYIKAVFNQVDIAKFSADKVFKNDQKSIALARKLAAENYMKGLDNKPIEERTLDDNRVDPDKYPYLNPNSSKGKNYAKEAENILARIYKDACDAAYNAYVTTLSGYVSSITNDKQDIEEQKGKISAEKTTISQEMQVIEGSVTAISEITKPNGKYLQATSYTKKKI